MAKIEVKVIGKFYLFPNNRALGENNLNANESEFVRKYDGVWKSQGVWQLYGVIESLANIEEAEKIQVQRKTSDSKQTEGASLRLFFLWKEISSYEIVAVVHVPSVGLS